MNTAKKTRSELKREAIIDGAKLAFQRYGVANTSMDKVSELAQVSKRTIYNHFSSKEALVTHIIKEIWGNTMLNDDIAYDPERDLRAQLLELMQNEFALMTNPDLLDLTRCVVGHCLFNPENFEQEIGEFFEQETALIRWIKAAMNDGKLRDDDPLTANEKIQSLLKGQALWPQLLHAEDALTEEAKTTLAEQTADMFLAYYATEK